MLFDKLGQGPLKPSSYNIFWALWSVEAWGLKSILCFVMIFDCGSFVCYLDPWLRLVDLSKEITFTQGQQPCLHYLHIYSYLTLYQACDRCSTSIYWLDERIWAIWEITDYQNLLKVISSLFHSLIQEIAEVYQLHISFRKRKKEISVSLCFVPAIDNAKVSALEKVKE